MAVVGCYTMDLYCDTGGEAFGGKCPETKPGLSNVSQFTGPNELDCLKQARRRGWTFRERATLAYCPACSRRAMARDLASL